MIPKSDRPRTRIARWTLPAAAIALGCTPDPGIPDRPPTAAPATIPLVVLGDWDDIPAALSRASSAAAVAVLRQRTTGDGALGSTAEAVVLAVDGQQARITIAAQGSWTPTSGPVPMRIDASFSTPNDPDRAAGLARAVGDGLEALAGRRVAPAR